MYFYGNGLVLNRILLISFFILCCLTVPADAGEQGSLLLDSSQRYLPLENHIAVLKDKNDALSYADILSPEQQARFQPSTLSKFNFGFSSAVIWLKFSLKNPTAQQQCWLLEIAYPMLDDIRLFEEGVEKGNMRQAGDMLPFRSREESYRNFFFNLHLPPSVTTTYYLRIQSNSSLNIPLHLMSSAVLQKRISLEQLLLGICFGAILMMVLYNFLLLVALRVMTYLHYVLFISASGIFLFTLNGLSFQYLWPDSIWWANNCLPILIFFCNIFCISFARSFLETVDRVPRFDRFMLIFISINLVLIFFVPFFSYGLIIRLATVLALIAALLSLTVAVRLALYLRQACFYLSAWLPLLLGIMVYGMKSFGFLPSNIFSEYAMNFGILLMITLLSLGVADRINTIRKERQAIQKQALEEQKSLTLSFERFVPKHFLYLLGKEHITDVSLGDNVLKDMSVLFTDIRSFTTMSEQMSPRENFQFLNAYLQRIDPVVVANHGVIDKYIGDAVMALF
ncbi:MAG: hypothetical protein KAI39_12535, partial [Desulfobulbaceae bacterium]|nr:hypothetical protein [Desulfobulbaceae bacterium]